MSKKSQKVKPIETVYNGYRFRSRLEARWAVFFDAMGWPYEYEPEGYNLMEFGCYLPDFWIPINPKNNSTQQTGAGCFIEIKGRQLTDHEREKIAMLAKHTKHTVKIFIGPPGDHLYISCHRGTSSILDFVNSPAYYNWKNDDCGNYPSELISMDVQLGYNTNVDISAAVKKAKQARFEHGETPQTTKSNRSR